MSAPMSIYVEFLTVKHWIIDIVPALRAREHSQKPCCYIFDATPLALWLSGLWAKREGFLIQKLDFQIVDVKDERGLAVFLRVLYQDAAQVQKLILNNPLFQDFISKLDPHSRARMYLEKSPVYSYDIYGHGKFSEIWHVLTITQIAHWHAQGAGHSRGPVLLYINQRPWLKELQEYAQMYEVDLKSSGAVKLWCWSWNTYKNKLKKLTFPLMKTLIRHKIFNFKEKYNLTQRKSYFTTSTVRLLTEYSGHLNLDDPKLQSDVFFVNGEGVGPKDILLSFNWAMDPIDKEKYQFLCKHQMAAVALSPQSCTVDPSLVEVFRFHPQPPINAIVHDTGIMNDEMKALASSLNEYHYLRAYWRRFLERYNIKLYTSWNKYETNHLAIADAIADVGGISTIYQRAYEPGSSSQVTVGADIIFGFSPNGYRIEKDNASQFHYYVTTGYVGDHRFEILRPYALDIRRKLLSHGAKQIIAYLDENSIEDGRWFMSHKSLKENYSFWLQQILGNPQLGMVFKPKRPSTLRQRLGKVNRLLLEAESTGRCFTFEGGLNQGSFPPAAAALAADIAIHDCLNAGTAGLEAALTGVATLLVDLEGWHLSPLYNLGPGVVFKDWPSVWRACCAFFKDPKGNGHLGDWSGYIHELDPFRDGKAALRMSQYLKQLLEGLRHGRKSDEIMLEVAERYAAKWGKDKVHYGNRIQ